MRLARFGGSSLRFGSIVVALVGATAACGDDSEGTSSGGGSSSDASTATSSGTSTAAGTSSSDATGSGGDATSGTGGEGGDGTGGGTGGGGTGGDGGAGGAALEVVEGPGFTSGSRLRPVYLDGGDGARKLLHWYDRELGLPCRFLEDTAAGDTYTCLPMGTGARIVFTDAACTDPAMVVSDAGCGARFASTTTDQEVVQANTGALTMRGTHTTWERGDELDPQPATFERTSGGACEPLPAADGERIHAAVVPTTPLVRATRELESLGGGLARAAAYGDDGSLQLMGPFHEDSGSPCQSLLNRTTVDGGSSCAPAVVAEFATPTIYLGTIHNADATCSSPAATLFTGDYLAEPVDFVVGPSDVQGELVAYERGEELDVAYSTHLVECAEHGSHQHHYAVGALLDRTFPQVFHVDVPGGRLGSGADGSADGEIAASANGFSDTAFDGDGCRAFVVAAENEDGTAPLRCVPGLQRPLNGLPFPSESDFFADPGCTDPLTEHAGGIVYSVQEVDAPACSTWTLPARDEVTKAVLFEPYDGEVYERWGDCRVYLGNGYPEYFSRRVRDLEPADFAIVTVVDPAPNAP